MTPSQIRAELLAQHAQIRGLIQEVLHCAEAARRGEAASGELGAAVALVAALLVAHNAREEELLGPILPTMDAWGPVRAAFMDDSHVAEHCALREALTEISRTPSQFTAGDVEFLCEQILEHMVSEEATMLSEDLLRSEDGVKVEVGA
jgi:hypothetical protein